MKFNILEAKKAGYTDEQINAYISQNNLEPYMPEQASQPTPMTTPQATSAGDKVGGLLIEILKSAAQPAVNTVNRVGGAGYELGRAGDSAIANLLGKLGANDASASFNRSASQTNPFLQDARAAQQASSPMQIAKDSAGVLAYGVPVGGKTSIAGKELLTSALGGGALSGAMTGFSQSGDSAQSMIGNTALGGATGGAMGVLMSKLLGAGKSAQKAGAKLQQGVAKTGESVKADPFYAKNIAELEKVRKGLGLKGNAGQQLEQLPVKFDQLNKQAGKILNELPEVPKAFPLKNFTAELDKVDYLGDEATFIKATNQLTDRISKAGGNPTALYNLKSELGGEMTPIFKKIQMGNPLMPKEATKYAAYNSLKNTLDELSPAIRQINMVQKQMYDISEGLVKSMEDPGGLSIPVLGKVGGESIQSGKDLLGRVLGAGREVPQAIADTASRAGVIGASNAVTAPATEQAVTPETVMAPETEQPQTNSEFSITPEMMMEARLALSNADYAKLKDMYDIQESAKKKEGGGTEAQIARASTTELIEDAFNQITSNPDIKSGFIAGPLESLKGQVNMGDQATLDFNTTVSNLAATIAKARGGTSFTPSEQAMLERYTPKVGDSKQILVTKLTQLRKQFGGK